MKWSILVLFLSAFASAQDKMPVVLGTNPVGNLLEKEVKAEIGKPIKLEPKIKGEVRFRVKSDKLTVIPNDWTVDKNTLVVVPLAAGKHLVECYACAEGTGLTDISECIIVVEGNTPVPPAPPEDPFVALLKNAFAVDAGQPEQKKQNLISLIGIYLAMVDYVNLPDNVNLLDLFEDLGKVTNSMIPKDALRKTRDVIAAELRSKLGDNPTQPLDAAKRLKCAELFKSIASALEKLR